MKQVLKVILLGLMLVSLSGCQSTSATNEKKNSTENLSNRNSSPQGNPQVMPEKKVLAGKKVLIAYFSYSGNTRSIAQQISENIEADLFEIKTVTSYPRDYDDCVTQAKEEQRNNTRPDLSTHVTNMDEYDTVFIGYPNWWGTMPMAMFTFLEEYNFQGKTIIPFCTHEGSRMGRSETDLSKLLSNAIVKKGLAIRGGSVNSAKGDISNWLKNL